VEEIDDDVRGSVRGAGREIERDRELAEWCSSGSSVGARRADWGAFYRRGEAVEEGGTVAGRPASFPAVINGVWTRRGVAERRRDSRQQYRRRDGSGRGRAARRASRGAWAWHRGVLQRSAWHRGRGMREQRAGGRRRKKGEGKKKREKEKERMGKEEKGEKEKVMSAEFAAGFAASVAS